MRIGLGTEGTKRLVGFVGIAATAMVGTVAAAPAATGSTAHVAPAVTEVTLSSSDTKVTSSSKHKLQVELDADQAPGSSAGDDLEITLTDGAADSDETHTWTFPVAATALKVSSSGKGTLKVSASKLAPYGQVSLTITPTGKAKPENCNGTPSDLVQKVKLAGTFFFDSKSTGAHKWGTVGSKSAKKKFTFSSTNTVTWEYLTEDQAGLLCGGDTGDGPELPCTTELLWNDSFDDVDLRGISLLGASVIEADRTVQLSKPARATREDDLIGSGPSPHLTTAPDPGLPGEFTASLAVTGDDGASGSTTIASTTSTGPQQLPCAGSTDSQSANISLWTQCTYTNGATPLSIPAEVFGPVTMPNNGAATIINVG